MKNYNVEIVEKIKEKFVSLNRVIKSIKQLDFYINREKTPADIITKKSLTVLLKTMALPAFTCTPAWIEQY